MATWQQSNAGSLLAGVGGNNANAPQASDANTALGLIRDNNDRTRAGENNLGMQMSNAVNSIMSSYQTARTQEQKKDFQSKLGNAVANNDRDSAQKLIAQYPQFMEDAQKQMGFIDTEQNKQTAGAAMNLRLASQSKDPNVMQAAIKQAMPVLQRFGMSPDDVYQSWQQNPQGFEHMADLIQLHADPGSYFGVVDKQQGREIDRGKLAEQVRSNQAGEANTRRGQDISMRGQNLSAATARRGQDMAMQRAQERAKKSGESNDRTVQLADGRTVTVGGKLHGAGANAFYEGMDNDGNMVRVPASAIAAPASSAANAQNYAMKQDIEAITNADPSSLGFMTGVTGGAGDPAIGADVRSRFSGKDQRQLYNASRRIQGRMQNQGVAAARDMGASGINTVAEAKLYFQGMPQVDYSSPEAMQQSIRNIQEYTNNYNQQYQVNVGGNRRVPSGSAPQQAQPAGVHTSKSGIQFTVE